MKELLVGLILLFLAAVYPLCWWISHVYYDAASTGIRQMIDQEVISTERASDLYVREGDVALNQALVRLITPPGNPIWKSIGLPVSLFFFVTGIVVFQAACEDRRRQNKSEHSTE